MQYLSVMCYEDVMKMCSMKQLTPACAELNNY